jgi:hypothetical protein
MKSKLQISTLIIKFVPKRDIFIAGKKFWSLFFLLNDVFDKANVVA